MTSIKVEEKKLKLNQSEKGEKNPDKGERNFIVSRQTTYLETLIHLCKSNIGPACFAMGEAMKHSGLLLGACLTAFLGAVCVYQQHILLRCADKVKIKFNLETRPDYAETFKMALMMNKRWKNYSNILGKICNLFLVLTQLGFCSVFFLFVGNNLKNVLDFYGIEYDLIAIMTLSLVPIILTSLITNLKYLAPFTGLANVCMFVGIIITFYYALQDLPDLSYRKLVVLSTTELPLFFGTAIYLYEGIGMVLPLKNAMRKPKSFQGTFGVLNVGMISLTILFITFGCVGYLRYGEDVASSLTLNLPPEELPAQLVMIVIPVGVILGYSLLFYVAIQIMLPTVVGSCKVATDHPLITEMIFRTVMVLSTFLIAVLVPNLGLLISFIGACCSTSLALVFPVLIEWLTLTGENESLTIFVIVKNSLILLLACGGFASGSYESVKQIIELRSKEV